MSEMVERVSYEMNRFHVEEKLSGAFFIIDGYTDAVVRDDLTAADEPEDIADEMNARAAIAAMLEPTEAMINEGEATIFEYAPSAQDWQMKMVREGWYAMIKAALK
jgi:hypothetical protein